MMSHESWVTNLYSLRRSNFDLEAVSARSVSPEVTVHVCSWCVIQVILEMFVTCFFGPGIEIQGVVLLSDVGWACILRDSLVGREEAEEGWDGGWEQTSQQFVTTTGWGASHPGHLDEEALTCFRPKMLSFSVILTKLWSFEAELAGFKDVMSGCWHTA